MSQLIPIQNIYYLLLYAWKRLDVAEEQEAGIAGETELLQLLTRLFCKEFNHLRRRWLDLSYVEQTSDLRGIRGRIHLTDTLRRGLLENAQVACMYDEISLDTLPHQIIKATCRRLASCSLLDKSLRRELSTICNQLSAVKDRKIQDQDFRYVHLDGRQRHYRLMMDLCAFILRQLFPDQRGKGWQFRSFLENEVEMRRLFESFVKGFCEVELGHCYRVKRDRLTWAVEGGSEADLALLPTLNTDVSLVSESHRLIIETKFTAEALKGNFGVEKYTRIHLSQLLVYLQASAHTHPEVPIHGLLLYPVARKKFKNTYPMLHNHRVTVASIDLAQPWAGIYNDLIDLVLGLGFI